MRAEVVTRQLGVRRAEPRVTCIESGCVGTPATGAERAAVSPGERREFIEHPGRRKRSERTLRRRVRAARAEIRWREPQRAVLDGERNVVRRSMPLDFVGLEERSLERARRDIERDPTRLRQHLERPLGHAILLPKVAVDAMTERRGLADVQDVTTGPKHAIDARRIGQ